VPLQRSAEPCSQGFSLIELLIVVAIILVLMAIAIPNLLRSKMSANEASAVSSMRTIVTAEAGYALTYPQIGYANSLSKLSTPPAGTAADSNAAGYLDQVLGCAAQPSSKSGYSFSLVNVVGSPVSAYQIISVPVTPGQSGIRGFCSDQASRFTYDPNGTSACSIPLQ
jgi:prepilin-type N-terminal cleavage/methylation domain-containing protein